MDYFATKEHHQLQPRKEKVITKNVIYLGELPEDTDQYDLTKFIQPQTDLHIDSLMLSQKHFQTKKFAYVRFASKDEAEKAVKILHLKEFNGAIIKASLFSKNDAGLKKGNTNLFVKNLSKETTPKDVKELFEKYGVIDSINLKKNSQGEYLGYGYVNFVDESSAKEALENLNNFELNGNQIHVSFFLNREKRMEEQQNLDFNEAPAYMLLVKNLPSSMKETEFKENFEKFGEIFYFGLTDSEGEEKMGVISFKNKKDGEEAMAKLKDIYEMSMEPWNKELYDKIEIEKKKIKQELYEGKNLIIKNLPEEINEDKLYKIFNKFGKISSARIKTVGKLVDKFNLKGEVIDKEYKYVSVGVAYVCFEKQEDKKLNLKERNFYLLLKTMIITKQKTIK